MLNADDAESVLALRLLVNVAAAGTRPLVFWVGAGASRWLRYPSWKDLALQLRKAVFQQSAGFDNKRAVELINKQDFPAIFQMCRDIDAAKYNKFIADTFVPRGQTSVFKTFTGLLGKISPPFVITTNVDEGLENALPMCAAVQRTDVTRCVDLLQRRIPFVAKLHGSVSSVQSMIFTTSDYATLLADSSYTQTLKYIFASCTVVFLGYGVRDSYVIRLLGENATDMELFGPGPHFVVTNNPVPVGSLRAIRYSLKIKSDHSATLSVLDTIIQSATTKAPTATVPGGTDALEHETNVPLRVPASKTAYYISDLLPPGTWSTSQEITAQGAGAVIEAAFGLGFTNDEIPFAVSTALHDLVVGLVCFDYTYLPLMALGQLFIMVGEDLVRDLVRADALRFIHSETKLGIVFRSGAAIGDIGNVTLQGMKGPGTTEPLSSRIRKILHSVPGKEKEAELLFGELERRTAAYSRGVEINLPSLVRGALLMPAVSRLLGIGDAILPSQTPRWLKYPYLRLAHLVETATLCAEYGIQAAKVPFGGPQLTTAAFGVQPAELQADHMASYASSGRYNSDLGALVYRDVSILRNILWFRGSADGESFRREVGQVLDLGSGREFNVSVNAGLSRTIPPNVLQRAQDKLLMLMTESARIAPVPAVWGNVAQSDSITKLWRAKSERMLLEMCDSRGIGKDDPCICESGEKLRLCCLTPLRR